MERSRFGFTWLLGFSFFHLLKDSLCIVCKAKPEEGSLLRFSYKQCASSCCGEEGDQYCCVVSKTVIIGCAIGGAFLIIIIIGVVCYLIHRSRKRKYQRSIRRRFRSVSDTPEPDISSTRTVAPLKGFENLEVRRFSQLSQVSMPSRIYHIPAENKPDHFSHPVRLLAMATVPAYYKDKQTSDITNDSVHV